MSDSKSIVDGIVDFLASVKLALVILFVLAAAAVIGTIIPQNLPPEQYIQGYGQGWYSFMYYLDLPDMYHSWWFNLLLAALLLNLTICSIMRFPATARLARPVDPDKISPDFLRKQSLRREFRMGEDEAGAKSLVEGAIRKEFGHLNEKRQPWGTLFWVDRGRFSRFGAYLVHISIFFIIGGAVVGNMGGYSANMILNEGDTGDEVEGVRPQGPIKLPFSLRLDDFTVQFYPTGAPSEFRSDVTVLEDGREVHKAAVRVNHPLTWQGVTFYQSTYGQNLKGPLGLTLTNKATGETHTVEVRPGFFQPVSGTDFSVGVMEVAENFQGLGPAARVVVRTAEGGSFQTIAVGKRPAGWPAEEGPFRVDLTGVSFGYYSGFQVNMDPGVVLVWTGCGLMMLGFLVTFLFSHRKVFAGVISEKSGTRTVLAGSTHRNPGSFRNKFERLADVLSGGSEVKGKK